MNCNSTEAKAKLTCGQIYGIDQILSDQIELIDWQKNAFNSFCTKISDDAFPCLFSKKAWKSKTIQLLFCEKCKSKEFAQFMTGMLEYTKFVLDVPLQNRLFSPLVVFFHNAFHCGKSQHSAAWRALDWIHARDKSPWPENIPTDANHPDWTYCFNGVQLFINMSSVSHKKLLSRNLGQNLVLVINPRENFDAVASIRNKKGKLVRQQIRNRVSIYNRGYVPEELGFYGDQENREWMQYQLEEEGLKRPKQCPLNLKNIGQHAKKSNFRMN